MRILASVLALVAVGAQQPLPPPFPRPGVTKLFENARVVVWNIAWPKGAPTALHRHVLDLVGTYYASGDRLITEVDGTKRTVTNKAGEVTFRQRGLTHIEEGISERPLRAVFIELKEDAPSGSTAPPSDAAPPFQTIVRKPILENARVIVWSYQSTFGLEGTRHRHDRDAVTVWSDDGTAHAVFVPAGTVHTEEQAGVVESATVFEIK